MRLFVGLGNPGSSYAMNRHNVGFMVADRFANLYEFSPWQKKGASLVSNGHIGVEKIILAKPQSYMNKSGLPIAEIIRFYKIDLNDVFVFHDDLDLTRGKLRVKAGGGHGGHNGLRDIDRHIGTDYWRVRIGIGRPLNEAMEVKTWVLKDFDLNEQVGWLTRLLDGIVEEADMLCNHDCGGFMSRVCHRAPTSSIERLDNKPLKP